MCAEIVLTISTLTNGSGEGRQEVWMAAFTTLVAISAAKLATCSANLYSNALSGHCAAETMSTILGALIDRKLLPTQQLGMMRPI